MKITWKIDKFASDVFPRLTLVAEREQWEVDLVDPQVRLRFPIVQATEEDYKPFIASFKKSDALVAGVSWSSERSLGKMTMIELTASRKQWFIRKLMWPSFVNTGNAEQTVNQLMETLKFNLQQSMHVMMHAYCEALLEAARKYVPQEGERIDMAKSLLTYLMDKPMHLEGAVDMPDHVKECLAPVAMKIKVWQQTQLGLPPVPKKEETES